MRTISSFAKYILFTILLFFRLAYASDNCQFVQVGGHDGVRQVYSITIGSVTVQRDAPVGTVLKTIDVDIIDHVYAGEITCDLVATMNYNGAVKTNSLENVYDTNIPGVGVSFYIAGNNNSGYASPPPGTLILEISRNNKVLYRPTIKLVKTGKITSGSLNNGLFTTVSFHAKDDISDGEELEYNLTGENMVTQVACSIKNGSSLSFPIGNVPANEFKSKGMASQETSTVNLSLECDADANINIQLTGTQNPDSSDLSVFALSKQGEKGVADGVGVQILYNNTPLELNKLLTLKKSGGGEENFPLTARYIQTKDKVIAGAANATATLDITYQ